MTIHDAEPIAVVGVGAIMPDAPDAGDVLGQHQGRPLQRSATCRRSAGIPTLYYDPDPQAPDKTYSQIGGWVRDFGWEPLAWKLPIPPEGRRRRWTTARSGRSPAARAALLDAGWPELDRRPRAGRRDPRQRDRRREALPQQPAHRVPRVRPGPGGSAVVRGAAARTCATPMLAETARPRSSTGFAEITEDTMPGELANFLAGRVANLFNLRGPNFTTDAACASGAGRDVGRGARACRPASSTRSITGGVDRNMGASAFVKFCKIGALSATGTRPFDAGADGFVMGEGAALFVLKRLADAERDGDRIYAVLLGVGGASDGRGKGITAPNPVGQRLAVERAWHDAGRRPGARPPASRRTARRPASATPSSWPASTEVFGKAGAAPGSIALGSVKSNIGHLKAAAGAAGPVQGGAQPARQGAAAEPALRASPTRTSTGTTSRSRSTPSCASGRRPRAARACAGVSAFGFGGTNFHAVLEEYVPGRHRAPDAQPVVRAARRSTHRSHDRRRGASTRRRTRRRRCGAPLVSAAQTTPSVAARLERARRRGVGRACARPGRAGPAPWRCARGAGRDRLRRRRRPGGQGRQGACRRCGGGNPAMWQMLRAQGVFLGRGAPGKVAFLYTGQGSQYVNMLGDLRERGADRRRRRSTRPTGSWRRCSAGR